MNNKFLNPERAEGESFESYRARRLAQKEYQKQVRNGWQPTRFVQHQPNLEKQWAEQEQQVKDNS